MIRAEFFRGIFERWAPPHAYGNLTVYVTCFVLGTTEWIGGSNRYRAGRDEEPCASAHEGWLEVVSHPRVKRAVEINGDMGLLLIN
jgi:hypothetical protein